MKSPIISLIAAIGKNRELGKGNDLIFKIPEDMKFFREKTRGHVVIMGRKTHESIGHPLPNRTNIVITRDSSFMIHDSNVNVVNSIEEALELGKKIELENYSSREEQSDESRSTNGGSRPASPAGGQARTIDPEVFVIGGAQIYGLAIPYADKLYLTLVDAEEKDADAFFPDYSEFKKIVSRRESSDENYKYTFLDLSRYK